MNANLKSTLFAGAASLLMIGGCNQGTDHQVARTPTDDAAYRTSQDYDRRSTEQDYNRDLPGTYATPREDLADKRLGDLQIAGDAQVLGMLTAIDKCEMHASGDAMTKELSAPVKAFTEMLHKDHGANIEKTNQIIKDLDLTLSIPDKGENLLNDGKTKVTDLSRLTGVEFERGYMLAMVQGHSDALRVIDDELIPAAKDKAVLDHLKASREAVAKHLEEARKIHESLNKSYENQSPTERSPL